MIKEGGSGLSAGLLTAVRKHRAALLPTTKATGINTDCRLQSRWAGIGTVGLANCYGVNGSRLPVDTINKPRSVGLTTDKGNQCIVASGDWNICAYDLEESVILDLFGPAIIWPSNGDVTCTQSAKCSLLDYPLITTRYLSLVQTCKIVSFGPCGAHKGVRVTFYAAPDT